MLGKGVGNEVEKTDNKSIHCGIQTRNTRNVLKFFFRSSLVLVCLITLSRFITLVNPREIKNYRQECARFVFWLYSSYDK